MVLVHETSSQCALRFYLTKPVLSLCVSSHWMFVFQLKNIATVLREAVDQWGIPKFCGFPRSKT